jgi:hypothetical protein
MGRGALFGVQNCEIELRFAIAGTDRRSETRAVRELSRSLFENASEGIAVAAVETAAAHLEERLDLADDREKWERIARHVRGADFRRFLSGHLATTLHQRMQSYIKAGAELTFDLAVAARIVHDALALHLFDNIALERLFAAHARGREQVMRGLAPAIEERLTELAAALAHAPVDPALPEFEVVVTTEELAAVDSARISTIRLRLDSALATPLAAGGES